MAFQEQLELFSKDHIILLKLELLVFRGDHVQADGFQISWADHAVLQQDEILLIQFFGILDRLLFLAVPAASPGI